MLYNGCALILNKIVFFCFSMNYKQNLGGTFKSRPKNSDLKMQVFHFYSCQLKGVNSTNDDYEAREEI